MELIATEVLTIIEKAEKDIRVVVNDEYLSKLPAGSSDKFLQAMFTVARKQLLEEITNIRSNRKIETVSQEVFKQIVCSVSLLIDELGEFSMVTRFGQLANPGTPLITGMTHALEVLSAVEGSMYENHV